MTRDSHKVHVNITITLETGQSRRNWEEEQEKKVRAYQWTLCLGNLGKLLWKQEVRQPLHVDEERVWGGVSVVVGAQRSDHRWRASEPGHPPGAHHRISGEGNKGAEEDGKIRGKFLYLFVHLFKRSNSYHGQESHHLLQCISQHDGSRRSTRDQAGRARQRLWNAHTHVQQLEETKTTWWHKVSVRRKIISQGKVPAHRLKLKKKLTGRGFGCGG